MEHSTAREQDPPPRRAEEAAVETEQARPFTKPKTLFSIHLKRTRIVLVEVSRYFL